MGFSIGVILGWIYSFVAIILIINVILKNRNSINTLAWVMVLLFLPILGMLLYFFMLIQSGIAIKRNENAFREFDFPLSICLGVLEHHEKENGKGYPRHLAGAGISPYAKIIAVACSFEAITSPRHYKEANSSYEAMVELLKNEGKQYKD